MTGYHITYFDDNAKSKSNILIFSNENDNHSEMINSVLKLVSFKGFKNCKASCADLTTKDVVYYNVNFDGSDYVLEERNL